MASISINAAAGDVCSGGGHLHLRVSIGGGATFRVVLETDDVRAGLTEDEREIVVRALLRLRLAGLTRAQARSALLAGVTATVG